MKRPNKATARSEMFVPSIFVTRIVRGSMKSGKLPYIQFEGLSIGASSSLDHGVW